jgi:hypothetical protein
MVQHFARVRLSWAGSRLRKLPYILLASRGRWPGTPLVAANYTAEELALLEELSGNLWYMDFSHPRTRLGTEVPDCRFGELTGRMHVADGLLPVLLLHEAIGVLPAGSYGLR